MKDFDYSIFAANEDDAKRVCENEDVDQIRDAFQRDRDRILYSKEFRRLSGKTQVFASGFDDNMRTRLTHTLEVAQIADTICCSLGLNQTLCEAIALGHDVGHTPFGHVGERTLNMIMNSCQKYYGYKITEKSDRGFKHNLQGLRVVMDLEAGYEKHDGLNLTNYTLWGIANHSKLKYKCCDYYLDSLKECRYRNCCEKCDKNGEFSLGFYDNYLQKIDSEKDWTIEAIIVGIADEIAQRHHDIEDGIFGGLIRLDTLKEKLDGCFPKEKEIINDIFSKKENITLFMRNLSRFIVRKYVVSYTEQLKKILKEEIAEKYDVKNFSDFKKHKAEIFKDHEQDLLDFFGFDNELKESDKILAEYLKNTILLSELAQTMDGKASFVIKRLFKAYLSNPQQLPDSAIVKIVKKHDGSDKNVSPSDARIKLNEYMNEKSDVFGVILLRTICDYIAGMTDQFAMQQFNKLYGTNEMRSGL